tara:strand:+ start:546 stop:698 length:153 start_codon:yes stop_codon:yes gene_type:complete
MRFLQKLGNAFMRSGYNEVAHNPERTVLQAEAKRLRNDARLAGALHWGAN